MGARSRDWLLTMTGAAASAAMIALPLSAPAYAQTKLLEPTTAPDITLSCQYLLGGYVFGQPASAQIWTSEHVVAWTQYGRRTLFPVEIGPTLISFAGYAAGSSDRMIVAIDRLTGRFSLRIPIGTHQNEQDGVCVLVKPQF